MPAATRRRKWTTAADLREQVRRLWRRGLVLRGLAGGEDEFPRRLVFSRPTAGEMRDRYVEVRDWVASFENLPQIRFERSEFGHRALGASELPHQAWLDSAEAAAALIGQGPRLRKFRALVEATRRREPQLLAWLARRPVRALELEPHWERLLGVVQWLRERGRPGVYIREMDVPGVDTKFVERNRGVLSQLLDLSLPEESLDRSKTGAAGFAARYGFRAKPDRVRLRVLDRNCALLPWSSDEDGQDLTLRAGTLARLAVPASRVFVIENEINFLALPRMPGTLAIFGSGYGFRSLARAGWLRGCQVLYWGDIDTHGFAILNELRGVFPRAESFLMDRATLLAFEHLWVRERSQARGELSRLTREECELYDDLRMDRLGMSVRLEQERVAFGWVMAALEGLPPLAEAGPGRPQTPTGAIR